MTLDHDFFPAHRDVRRCKDQYVDEVAIERAMKGDPAVLQPMTPVERFALLNAITDKYDPTDQVATGGGGKDGFPLMQTRLILELSEAWGMDYDYLAAKVKNRARRKYETQWRVKKAVA